jgi:hypothetical protein
VTRLRLTSIDGDSQPALLESGLSPYELIKLISVERMEALEALDAGSSTYLSGVAASAAWMAAMHLGRYSRRDGDPRFLTRAQTYVGHLTYLLEELDRPGPGRPGSRAPLAASGQSR